MKVVDKMVYKFDNFAKFDTVHDHSDHHYSTRKCSEVVRGSLMSTYLIMSIVT